MNEEQIKVIASVTVNNAKFEREFTRAVDAIERSTEGITNSVNRLYNIINNFQFEIRLLICSASFSMMLLSGIALFKVLKKPGNRKL